MKGGAQPRWCKNGKELFFVQDETLMAVPISTVPDPLLGAASPLFEDRDGLSRGRGWHYDVSSDGRRFVLVETLKKSTLSIRVVQTWFAEFRHPQQSRRRPE